MAHFGKLNGLGAVSGVGDGSLDCCDRAVPLHSFNYLPSRGREVKKGISVESKEEKAGGGVVGEVGDVCVQEPARVELGQTDRGPALRVLEALGRVDQVEHKMKVGWMDEIFLHSNKRNELVFCDQDPKHDIRNLSCKPDNTLGHIVPHSGGQWEASHCRQEKRWVAVHRLRKVSHQPLAPLQHSSQVVVSPLNKNPLQLGGGQRGEDLVVDVGQLDGQLGGAEASPGHCHQNQRALHQEHELRAAGANTSDRIPRVRYKGHQGLHDPSQGHQVLLLPMQ